MINQIYKILASKHNESLLCYLVVVILKKKYC